MTYLYLDFDGVLHADSVYNTRGRPELMAPGVLFQHAHILEEALGYHPEVKIVLSTSWVGAFGFEVTLAYLSAGIRDRVVGHTHFELAAVDMYSTLRFSDLTRFQQIMAHVENSGITNWLALDDLHSQSQDWPSSHAQHLVLCHPDTGLSDPEVQAALNTALLERQHAR
jgi:hypothetical protein